ncbi:hypothetical protein BBJ29_000850 [Phytophthora kernoviae]|uniref:Uncharacterized protein n=1 Tax=Phytophthora kernoviae TaxID=325452 RepID=A0A3F2S2T7_9STRA|nr:hypothetical protein BBJ29_000850 [Phytophthora kernoviae]RLN69124.1 hypothetical protein BBP00_00000566 [Phytophthora kernoviae]
MRHTFDIARFETRLPECPLSKTEFTQLSIEEKYEHARHLFANQVTANGYGASVLLFRLKSKEEKSDKKSAEGPVVPPGYVPNVVIGLDPGMRAVSVRRVAYGDWSRRKGIKGHAPRPVKGLKEVLRKRATVVSMDEFRTSKLCSQCHQTLSKVRYSMDTKLPKRKKRKGVILVRNRAEVEFEEKKCHAVLRCDHDDCGARYWDRDVTQWHRRSPVRYCGAWKTPREWRRENVSWCIRRCVDGSISGSGSATGNTVGSPSVDGSISGPGSTTSNTVGSPSVDGSISGPGSATGNTVGSDMSGLANKTPAINTPTTRPTSSRAVDAPTLSTCTVITVLAMLVVAIL